MIDVVGELLSVVDGLENVLFFSVLGALALYSIKFEYADKLAVDMALASCPQSELDELGWVPLTELNGAQSKINDKASRRLAHRRIVIWGLPKFKGLNAPTKSAVRRYRLNTLVAILAGALAASHFSVWLTGLLLLFCLVVFLRTPNWPVPKELNT